MASSVLQSAGAHASLRVRRPSEKGSAARVPQNADAYCFADCAAIFGFATIFEWTAIFELRGSNERAST